ncbi:hypothetical protein VB773_17855 [Haloarculaceae archaeon H-GB2-1]|nr:hypothetical protein [Haloarculaceae archaeon H-GB1-1]MEA5387760.1 hypothetical protein [Haloarculaceae archaeon H-GB11]MEA5409253.1 hypothetical protein [Haloarculaceae archaeon H-GB2-1]
MPCDNCLAEREPAYELTAKPANDDARIELAFCSVECLQAWV